MNGGHYIINSSNLEGKSISWIKENIRGLEILSVKHGINRKPVDTHCLNCLLGRYRTRNRDYTEAKGTPREKLRLMNLSVPVCNNY